MFFAGGLWYNTSVRLFGRTTMHSARPSHTEKSPAKARHAEPGGRQTHEIMLYTLIVATLQGTRTERSAGKYVNVFTKRACAR